MTGTNGVSPYRRFLPFALWALLALIFVAGHSRFYFGEAFYESGDAAANALQIRQAKGFHEIYGNYSRFGFHHPGPAFFYAYALGERLLFDILKLVPTPSNAHALVGVLLQLCFFVWAVWIVQRRVRRPLVLPLLLLFAALHFGAVNYFLENTVFQSIWPPHVLLMPFLCFLVACASVASGESTDVVPLALSGSLLVHGHVAQPMFVVPLTIIALVANWRARRGTPLFTRHHAVALAIIAVFLVPIGLDLLRGEQSNLRLIAAHFTEHSGEHKSFAQSALYGLAFLCHVAEPEKFCGQLTAASFNFIRARWYFLVMWGAVAAAIPIVSKFQRSREHHAFARWLALFFAFAVGLTLVWGKIQTGEMFEFNSHFNFAILFLPFVLLAIAIASAVAPGGEKWLPRASFVCSLPLLYFASRNLKIGPDFPTLPRDSVALHQQIAAAALNDLQSSHTKLLLFEPEEWGEAVRVALELERLKYRYRVDRGWTVIFGAGRGVDPVEALSNPNLAVWRIRSSALGPYWLGSGLQVVDPRGSEILFSTARENAHEFVNSGWDISRGPFSWSVGKTAVIRFAPRHATANVRVICDVSPAAGSQVMAMTFNQGAFKAFQVDGKSTAVFEIPADVWNAKPTAMLKFDFPQAQSPQSQGISDDPRELGCAFTRIRFVPADGESEIAGGSPGEREEPAAPSSGAPVIPAAEVFLQPDVKADK
jgi:hypothetical protein